jgi:hypothetical protein
MSVMHPPGALSVVGRRGPACADIARAMAWGLLLPRDRETRRSPSSLGDRRVAWPLGRMHISIVALAGSAASLVVMLAFHVWLARSAPRD